MFPNTIEKIFRVRVSSESKSSLGGGHGRWFVQRPGWAREVTLEGSSALEQAIQVRCAFGATEYIQKPDFYKYTAANAPRRELIIDRCDEPRRPCSLQPSSACVRVFRNAAA